MLICSQIDSVSAEHGPHSALNITEQSSDILLEGQHTQPPFLKGPSGLCARESFLFLYERGAVSIPSTELRNQLLQSYTEHVHGDMPILDLSDYIQVIERGDGLTGQGSLLLLQSVMFAGLAFVDLQHLIKAGFTSRKAARKAFFTKARVGHLIP